jgi:hypothetical protein
MSLREKILAAEDIESEMLEVPEWDCTVEVRGMNGADRSRILESAAASEDGKISIGNMYVETVIASTYDPETGERIFTNADRDVLMSKSAAAIDKIATVGMRLSAMDTKAADDAKATFPETTTS